MEQTAQFEGLGHAELIATGGLAEIYQLTNRIRGGVAARAIKIARFGGELQMLSVQPYVAREAEIMEKLSNIPAPCLPRNTEYIPEISVERFNKKGSSRRRQQAIMYDWIPGEALDKYFSNLAYQSDYRIAHIGAHIADALKTVHENGILHRDIKPENIILRDSRPENVCLIDFGLAHDVELIDFPHERLDGVDGVIGTVAYMSPEALFGERMDPRRDIYAAGVILYNELSGTREFPRETFDSRRRKLKTEPRPHPCTLSTSHDSRLREIVYAMTEPKVEDRMATAEEAARALHEVAERLYEPYVQEQRAMW